MVLLLLLATGVVLCMPDDIRAEENTQANNSNPLKDIQKKVDDLWQSLLYPQLYENFVATHQIGFATCEVKPSCKLEEGKPQVRGHVLFRQAYPQGKLEVIFHLNGFPTDNNQSGRAIHIHQFGDISDGCDSAGGHYNPFNVNHPRHPGDFGNFYPKDGKIKKYKPNLTATLFGPYSVIGRSVVIHEQEDDMGRGNNKASLANGNAGKRLACCVIGSCTQSLWEKNFLEVRENRRKRLTERAQNSQV
ncbi:extracellular superoxide dismutase [Cu-Zn] [Tiliqua scincoides]|uniref:extracellular superoxide dismutase [Cu-Zn] n=1 Tax=Tiliqua scincoides TaxID=71010 RepID=UPI003462FCC6